MPIRFEGLSSKEVLRLQQGGLDAYGNKPERHISDGEGIPCRHCLKNVAKGEPFLIVSFRPFNSLQPYAETGPIFLHADGCQRGTSTNAVPEILESPDYIVRGYDAGERIVYGTGSVVPTAQIPAYAQSILEDPQIAFVHVRSSRNNCFQCRIERG